VFKEAIKAAVAYKEHSTDFLDDVMRELEVSDVLVLVYIVNCYCLVTVLLSQKNSLLILWPTFCVVSYSVQDIG